MLKSLQLGKIRQLAQNKIWKSKPIKILSAAILLVLCVFLIASFLSKRADNQTTQQVKNKIEELNQKRDSITCADVLGELGSVSVEDVNNSDVKADLLERQMQCNADHLDYDKAIASAEKLRALYEAKKDSGNAERMTIEIANMKKSQEQIKNEKSYDNQQ